MKLILKNCSLNFVFGTSTNAITEKSAYYNTLDHQFMFNDGYSCSRIFEVQVGTTISVKNCGTGPGCYIIQAFDANMNQLDSLSYGVNTVQATDVVYEMTIANANVKYIVVNTRDENFTPPYSNYFAEISNYIRILPIPEQ